ncbi:MAG: hypothetical protein LCH86_06210 [Proteobacteria bacterium]|nr:hypothetical protein [Pseudomonadota bacterium]
MKIHSKSSLCERSNLKPSELKSPSKPSYLRRLEQRRASERWFNGLVTEFYKRNAASIFPDRVEFLECCAFFLTMTFSTYRIEREKRRLELPDNDFSVEIDNFHKLYVGLARKQFGSHYNERKFEAKLPLAIACVDYEGSRFQAEVPQRPKNVHVHAVWVVHPDEIETFRAIISNPWFKLKLENGLHTDRIRFDPYLAKKDKNGRWVGYAAKSWIKAAEVPDGAEMIRIYPNSNYGGIPYRASHQYRAPNKSLELLRRIARQKAGKEAAGA